MLSSELRNQIIKFVDQEISIEELEDWYVPRLPFFLNSPHSSDAEVIAALELALHEFSSGTISENELRMTLLDAIRDKETIIYTSDDVVATGSRSNLVVSPISSTNDFTEEAVSIQS